jgi:hypothetical protein
MAAGVAVGAVAMPGEALSAGAGEGAAVAAAAVAVAVALCVSVANLEISLLLGMAAAAWRRRAASDPPRSVAARCLMTLAPELMPSMDGADGMCGFGLVSCGAFGLMALAAATTGIGFLATDIASMDARRRAVRL